MRIECEWCGLSTFYVSLFLVVVMLSELNSATPAIAQENAVEGIVAYERGEYGVAEKLLGALRREEMPESEYALALSYLAATLGATGRPDEARVIYRDLLSFSPGFRLSENEFSPKLRGLFDKARWGLVSKLEKQAIEAMLVNDMKVAIECYEKLNVLDQDSVEKYEKWATVARDRLRILEPPRPPPLTVRGLAPQGYSIGRLVAGARIYVDRDYLLKCVPEAYRDKVLIKSCNDDRKDGEISVDFEVNVPVVVYVAYDQRGSLPSWLAQFEKTGDEIIVEETGSESVLVIYDVYRMKMGVGRMRLGPNVEGRGRRRHSMYFVFLDSGNLLATVD